MPRYTSPSENVEPQKEKKKTTHPRKDSINQADASSSALNPSTLPSAPSVPKRPSQITTMPVFKGAEEIYCKKTLFGNG